MKEKSILKFYINDEGILEKEIIPCEQGDIDYKILSENVEGYIECVYYCDFGKDNLIAVVNEEGLLKHMKPTFYVVDGDELFTPYPLVGNVLIVATSGEELHGLDPSDIEIINDKVFTGEERYYIRASENYKSNSKETIEFLRSLGCVEITMLPDEEIEKEYSL